MDENSAKVLNSKVGIVQELIQEMLIVHNTVDRQANSDEQQIQTVTNTHNFNFAQARQQVCNEYNDLKVHYERLQYQKNKILELIQPSNSSNNGNGNDESEESSEEKQLEMLDKYNQILSSSEYNWIDGLLPLVQVDQQFYHQWQLLKQEIALANLEETATNDIQAQGQNATNNLAPSTSYNYNSPTLPVPRDSPLPFSDLIHIIPTPTTNTFPQSSTTSSSSTTPTHHTPFQMNQTGQSTGLQPQDHEMHYHGQPNDPSLNAETIPHISSPHEVLQQLHPYN